MLLGKAGNTPLDPSESKKSQTNYSSKQSVSHRLAHCKHLSFQVPPRAFFGLVWLAKGPEEWVRT